MNEEQWNTEYLKINPKGVVPSLIHDDGIVVESSVISQYIDHHFDDAERIRLTPGNPDLRTSMQAWIDALAIQL